MRVTNRPVVLKTLGAKLLVGFALGVLCLSGCTAPAAQVENSATEQQPTEAPKPKVPDVPQSSAILSDQVTTQTVPPTRISIAAIALSMDVQPEGLDDTGQMAVPTNSQVAGWYKFGPGLSATSGAIVIVSHIDAYQGGIGPFSRIGDLAVGAPIEVTGDTGAVTTYLTQSIEQIPKTDVQWASIFDRAGSPRLVLVTCGGEFNYQTGHYLDNIIVTATPTSP